jgi:hypothetical protein
LPPAAAVDRVLADAGRLAALPHVGSFMTRLATHA